MVSEEPEIIEVTINGRRFLLSPAYSTKRNWYCSAIEVLEGGEWLHWDDPITSDGKSRQMSLEMAALNLMSYVLDDDGDMQ